MATIPRHDLLHTLLTEGLRGAQQRYQVTAPVLQALRICYEIPSWVIHPMQRTILQMLATHGPVRLARLRALFQTTPLPSRQNLHTILTRMVQLGYLCRTESPEGVPVYTLAPHVQATLTEIAPLLEETTV